MMITNLKITILLLFINLNMAICQNYNIYDFHIDSLIEYKIDNAELIQALDSGIINVEKFGYYKIHPYLIWISILDSNKIDISYFPYAQTMIHDFLHFPLDRFRGICFYKKHNILISSKINGEIDIFFHSTNQIKKLYYKNSENILDHSGLYRFSNFYEITNGKFNIDDDDQLSEFYSFEFYYMIKKGDTWVDISKILKCKVEDLIKEFPEMETPLEGYLLKIVYTFENSTLKKITRLF